MSSGTYLSASAATTTFGTTVYRGANRKYSFILLLHYFLKNNYNFQSLQQFLHMRCGRIDRSDCHASNSIVIETMTELRLCSHLHHKNSELVDILKYKDIWSVVLHETKLIYNIQSNQDVLPVILIHFIILPKLLHILRYEKFNTNNLARRFT